MLTFLPTEKCRELGSYKDERINKSKEILAFEVTKIIHGEEKATQALETSKALFSGELLDENMPSTDVNKSEFENGIAGILDLIRICGLSKSNGEARRLIDQGGISLNGEKVTDSNLKVDLNSETEFVIKKGRKVYHKVVVL